ncbi:MAG: KpsF/GutQ family sugar-phosphate isomerase [Leptospirales bacterium]
MNDDWRLQKAREVLHDEAQAVSGLMKSLERSFSEAVGTLLMRPGKVAVTGMGKSGHVAGKIAATLASTGTPAFFLHPGEAVHGDLGVLDDGDTLLALSKSGETQEILDLIPLLKRLGIPILSMVCERESSLAKVSDHVLWINVRREAGPLGLAPTSSTTAMLAMGDALAMVLLEERNFEVPDFARLHPGGMLGRRYYLRVQDLMHVGSDLPVVSPETPLRRVIMEMTAKKLGVAAVCTPDRTLLGILTDGDLRRILEGVSGAPKGSPLFLEEPVSLSMTPHPVTIDREILASEAVAIMESRKISHLLVADVDGHLEGILHFHDCLRAKVI